MNRHLNASTSEPMSEFTKNLWIGLLTVSIFLGACLTATAQPRSVRVTPGSVTATKGGKSVVVESTLSGVGVMLSGARDARSGHVEVEYDADAGRYLVLANGEAQVEMDANTGRYQVLTDDADVNVTIRNSLSGAGVIVRAGSNRGSVELSGAQVRAMKRSWRYYGMNDAEIEVQLHELEGAGREVEGALDEAADALAEVDAVLGGSRSRRGKVRVRSGRRSRSGGRTLYCSGNQELIIENRNISVAGPAIEVEGNCEVVISDSFITSTDDVAIIVRGNGEVHIEDSQITGAVGSIEYSGRADIEATNSVFSGEVIQAGGDASLKDRGGNVFR